MNAATATTTGTVKLTPMMRQYLEVKEGVPDAILLFRLGDFYEMFFEDAEIASRVLDLTLTSRNKGEEGAVPLCGVPHHSVQPYVTRLLDAGHKVAICEQVEDPAAAKGIVRREVVRVVTPGTVLEEESLDPCTPSYLAVVHFDGRSGAIAVADLTTGELRAAEVGGLDLLREELARLRPREVIAAEGSLSAELLAASGALRTGTIPADRFARDELTAWLFERGEEEAAGDWTARPRAAAALAGLLSCLRAQLVPLEHLRRPEPWEADGFLAIDDTSRRNLELVEASGGGRKGSLLGVLDRTLTPTGARRLRRWILYPLLDPAAIGERLDGVEELACEAPLRDELRQSLDGLGDLERLAGRIGSATASPRDVERLGQALARAGILKDRLAPARAPLLATGREAVAPLPDLQATIAGALVDEAPATTRQGDVIRQGYSAEIDELRRLRHDGKSWISSLEAAERKRTGISSLKVRYNKVFGYYIEVTKANLRLVPETYQRKQTIAGGERYITPELKEYESKVLGAEVRLRRLEAELFSGLVATAASHLPEILRTADAVGRIDAIASLADVAERGSFVRPAIDRSKGLEIRDGRHPVVEQMLAAGRFVPNDTALDPDEAQIAILTGPNMAGKSTWLRQNALLVLLAQMGSFVPAQSARIGIVDRIFTRVGAADNLAAGDSTFMVEMRETAHILTHLTDRSLVILDEIGRGTSTFDGISIAWAVAEFLHDSPLRPKTLFATHYHELTEITATAARAVNLSIAVKEWQGDIVFLRRIVAGPASQSYGIHVARLAGVPEPVIVRAREILSNLEQGEREEGPRFATGGVPADQLGLFNQPRIHPLVEELSALDPSTLSPLEALQRLYDLVARSKE